LIKTNIQFIGFDDTIVHRNPDMQSKCDSKSCPLRSTYVSLILAFITFIPWLRRLYHRYHRVCNSIQFKPVYSEHSYREYLLIVVSVSPHRSLIYSQIKYVYSEYTSLVNTFFLHRPVHYKRDRLYLYLAYNQLMNLLFRPIMIAVQKVTNVGFSLHDGLAKPYESLNAEQKRYAIKY
jgi:hypothetical protein